jgi:hypothetical protein
LSRWSRSAHALLVHPFSQRIQTNRSVVCIAFRQCNYYVARVSDFGHKLPLCLSICLSIDVFDCANAKQTVEYWRMSGRPVVSEHPGHREELRACLAEEWQRDGRGLWARRTCRLWAPHGNRHDFSSWEYNVQPPLRDAASSLPSDPPQTCRDHGPHLGFHWCPECYQRAFTAGVESTQGSGRDVALEGALKAKAEEWRKKTAGYSVWDDAADEIDALRSAPAAAGSEPK